MWTILCSGCLYFIQWLETVLMLNIHDKSVLEYMMSWRYCYVNDVITLIVVNDVTMLIVVNDVIMLVNTIVVLRVKELLDYIFTGEYGISKQVSRWIWLTISHPCMPTIVGPIMEYVTKNKAPVLTLCIMRQFSRHYSSQT